MWVTWIRRNPFSTHVSSFDRSVARPLLTLAGLQVTEELLWELMLQGGPVVNVFIPKDKLTSQHMG